MEQCEKQNGFYGTTTVGERGQVVIPAKARKNFKLEKGEHLLVCGGGENIIVFIKAGHAKKFAANLAKKMKPINSAINKMV